jgi:hypothetical protein
MKMVKRMLIAIAVVALVATSVQAGINDVQNGKLKQDDAWPTEYIALDLCTIPVVMDVGMYIQIKDCNKKKIKLVQVNCDDIGKSGKFPCYYDCEEIEVRANFAAVLGLKKAKTDPSPLKDWEAYFDGDNTVPGDGEPHKINICVKAWSAEIWKAQPDDEVPAGSVTVTVKPQ